MKTITIGPVEDIPDNFTGKAKRIGLRIKKITTHKNGLYHSYNDEPAYTNVNTNYQSWWKNGRRHRGNGKVAIIDPFEKRDVYYINDKKVSKESAKVYALLFNKENEED